MTLDLQPGASFSDYFLERRLGGGGFGDVWLARNTAGQSVALKVLNGHYQSSETARVRAEIELLAAAASSSSSHIVRVLGGGSEPAPYVVMEYVDGIDLGREIARRGALPVAEVLRIGAGIADALGTLELAGIIHRDVKPANVMIDKQGVVKLMDFGIAKIVGIDSATATSQMPMSMAYAAPEVWDGKASYLSDHYAFGALLYQCLVGKPPFTGSYAEIYRHHLETEPDLNALPAETPPSLRRLIGSCLAKDQELRPPNAPAIQAALSAAETELNAGSIATVINPRVREPKQLGPWVINHRSQDRDWSFSCHNETTFEDAVVELHFGPSLEYGYALRKAVEVNPKLLALGAERLIGTSRFVLRPGEAWKDAPEGAFQFWVARAVLPRTPTSEISPDALHAAAEALHSMIKLAAEEGVNLSLRPENIWFSPSGRVHVERPGLPPYDDADPFVAADAWLSGEIAKLAAARPEAAAQPSWAFDSQASRVPDALPSPPTGEQPPVAHPSWAFDSQASRVPDALPSRPAGEQPPAAHPSWAFDAQASRVPDAPPGPPVHEQPPVAQPAWAFDARGSQAPEVPSTPPASAQSQTDAPYSDQLFPDVPHPPRRVRTAASFGRRAAAYMIDWVAIVVLWFMTFVVLGIFAAIFGISTSDGVSGWLIWPITAVAFPVYHFAFAAGLGRTTGMWLLGMSIWPEGDEGAVTPNQAAVRTIVLYIGSLFLLGCLWMLWDPAHQTLHDKASKTRVVH